MSSSNIEIQSSVLRVLSLQKRHFRETASADNPALAKWHSHAVLADLKPVRVREYKKVMCNSNKTFRS